MPDFSTPRSILDLLNLALYDIISSSGSLVTRICESDYGITREEWQFLALLADTGPLSPSEIAQGTGVDRSQVSKTLAGLVQKQLALRQRVAGDARRVQLCISSDGRALYQLMFPRAVAVHQALLQGFSPLERKRLATDLARIQSNAQAATQALGPQDTAPRRFGGGRRRWPV